MKIYQKVMPFRKEAFWYDGPIASIGKYVLIATGEIRLTFPDGQSFRDNQAVKEAFHRGYKDKDLNKPGMFWDSNNWFEVVYGTVKNEKVTIEDCLMGDVEYDYSSGIKSLVLYVKDKTYENVSSK